MVHTGIMMHIIGADKDFPARLALLYEESESIGPLWFYFMSVDSILGTNPTPNNLVSWN